MEKEKHIDNRVFINAFLGAALFIITVVASLATLPYFKQLQMLYFLVPAITGSPSAILLYRAWKKDKFRLRQFNGN